MNLQEALKWVIIGLYATYEMTLGYLDLLLQQGYTFVGILDFLPWNEDSCLHYLYVLGILVSNKKADKITERGLIKGKKNMKLSSQWSNHCVSQFLI